MKLQKVERNSHEIDLAKDDDEVEYEQLLDSIVKTRDFNYIYNKDRKKAEMIFNTDYLGIYVPNHLHLGALIRALIKQIRFQIRWHKISYQQYKEQNRIKLSPPKLRKNQTLHVIFSSLFVLVNVSRDGTYDSYKMTVRK